MRAVFKKDLFSFFYSLAGFFYLAFFLMLFGIFFAMFNLRGGAAEFGYALGNSSVILLVFVPLITMRAVGEERRSRTDQLLLTSGVTVRSIILGKFLALSVFLMVPVVFVLACPLILARYGTISLLQAYSCIFVFVLMGCACIAVGLFISTLTDKTILSASVTFAVLLFAYMADRLSGMLPVSSASPAVVILKKILSLFYLFRNYYDFTDGVFHVPHLVYYCGVIVIFLYAAVFSLDSAYADRKKQLENGFVLVCVIVSAALLYRITGQLPPSFTDYDISADRIYTISDQTEKILAEVSEPVRITLVASEGNEDQRLLQLVDSYTAKSPLVTRNIVDPVRDPGFSIQYTTDLLEDNSLILSSGERSRVIHNRDIYTTTFDYNTGDSSELFDGEGQISAAVRYLTTDHLYKVLRLTGHGNAALPETFEKQAAREGIEMGSFNTLSGNVPSDADALLLYAPVKDLSKAEGTLISNYLSEGGKLMVFTGASSPELPVLSAVLEEYGFAAVRGVIIEADPNMCIPSYANFLLPKSGVHEITKPLTEGDELVLVPNAHGIRKADNVRRTVNTYELLKTSENSYIKANAADGNYHEGDPVGPFAVAVCSEETAGSRTSRVVWFASTDMAGEDVDGMVSGNNTDLVMNALQWMAGNEGGISIRPRSLKQQALRLTASQSAFWEGVFVWAIPALWIAAGIVLSTVRKRRQ